VTFGLWPAWSATRVDLIPALRVTNGAPTGGWRRIRAGRALVAAQVALAVLVVAVAALLGRTLHNLRAAPAGFDPAAVTLFIADAERANLPAVRLSAFQTELLQRVRALPGVVAASESWTSPLNTRGNGRAILRPDLPQTFESLGVFTNVVTPDYFPTIGIRLLHGRLLSDADTGQSRPVAVVNATMATFFFGDSNAVGRTFRFRSQADRDIHVVGVVQDVAQYNLRDPFLKMAFVPQSQGLEPMRHITVAVRMAGGAVLDAAVVRRIVRELNPDVMVRHLRTMHQDVDESLKRERMLAGLSGGFAAVALLLAAVGLYGVVSFDVARRRRDIGVRMALGASRTRVLSQVMRQTVATSMAGVAAGLVLAWAGTLATAALLWGLSPRDPLALGLAALILFTIACAAGYLPARRAANLDPMAVLRSE
jgi:predicted permease